MIGLVPSQNPATNGVPLEAAPSTDQGFGRVTLNTSLPLGGTSALNLQVGPSATIVKHLQHLCASAGGSNWHCVSMGEEHATLASTPPGPRHRHSRQAWLGCLVGLLQRGPSVSGYKHDRHPSSSLLCDLMATCRPMQGGQPCTPGAPGKQAVPNSAVHLLQLLDRVPMPRTGVTHKYCVNSTGGPLAITLAWHDPPADASAAVQLVNDLDLTVYANAVSGYAARGNGGTAPDRLNNVERVSNSLDWMSTFPAVP